MNMLNTANLKKLTPFISLILFVIAALAVNRQITDYGWKNIVGDLLNSPSETLVQMLVMSILGYITLSACEWVAVKYTREKLDYKYILFGSPLKNINGIINLEPFQSCVVEVK